ncbi:DUF6998 domain-containing protein [Aridibaculum aurantiacum]|uniref:DUF6998 domain-containing protein n=1 Tax=Aridibaculum aurantiacum TaxID=2810307 RepID=UPI001A95D5B6|nr:hypothetical protein [Aridibaculum aurantiacum]
MIGKEEQLYEILGAAKKAAIEYKKLTGKPLGITGEIAEVEVARIFKCQLCIARQEGYDLIGEKGEKIQVKGRVYNHNHRVPSININKVWDTVTLVLLNQNYIPFLIFKAKRKVIVDTLLVPGSKARNERFSMSVSKFVSISELIYENRKANLNGVSFRLIKRSKKIIEE